MITIKISNAIMVFFFLIFILKLSLWLGLVDVFQEDLRNLLLVPGKEIPIFTSNEQMNCLAGTIHT